MTDKKSQKTGKESPKSKPTDEAPNLGKNPTSRPRRRASERGIGRRYSEGSDTWSNPESSPTSKTP